MNLKLKLQKEFNSLDSEARFVLGVSGGRDSIALLDLASKLIPDRFIIAHFNHGLRKESDTEQVFVQSLAKKYKIEFYTDKAEAFDSKQNLEAWARLHRYDFLHKIIKEKSADFILTAHHKDDLAETILMRIIQGRASLSAGGILKLDTARKLFRPMLSVDRFEIDRYVSENNLEYIEDSSNTDTSRLRNKIRLELLPEIIKEYNPSIVDSLALLANRLKSDDEAIWQQVCQLFTRKSGSETDFFHNQPMFLRWRLLKLEIESQVGESKVGYKALLRLAEALSTSEGSKKVIELGWGISCEFRRKGNINFTVNK